MNRVADKKKHLFRVLTVEDDSEMRELLVTELLDQGYEVAGAVDGTDALDKMVEKKYDLVITDLQMPKMGGLALLNYMGHCFPELPVIVITAFGDEASLKEAYARGAHNTLSKPFKMQEIKDLVTRALNRRGGQGS